jgi:hypothetical protein
MLKKKIVMLIAAAMMTLSASSAFAAFADMELIRVVYERTTGTTEQVTDLGTISSNLTGTHTYAGATLTANNSANLFATYFAVNKNTGDMWVSGSSDTTIAPVAVGTPGFTSFKNGVGGVYLTYNAATPDANGVRTGLQSAPNSFKTKLDANQGAFGNAVNIATRVNSEISLASLVGAASGSVTQNLYFLNGNAAGSVGQLVASITTSANGSTTVAAPTATTPIPPAFFLMGSGLLGMFGLRRKNKVA